MMAQRSKDADANSWSFIVVDGVNQEALCSGRCEYV
jgi:hypothetical protein